MITPRGVRPSTIMHRYFANGSPQSYDAVSHSCEAVLSTGAAVQRIFGREVLRISPDAVDLSRVPCPLLDSHSQASIDNIIGRVDEAWVDGGKVHSRITFAQTPRGKLAEGMVSRGELRALSCGYRVDEWSAVDVDGDPINPARAFDYGDDVTFTAERWQILEASCVGVGADAGALVRSLSPGRSTIADVRARMEARQQMHEAHAEFFDQGDDDDQLGSEHEPWRFRLWRPSW